MGKVKREKRKVKSGLGLGVSQEGFVAVDFVEEVTLGVDGELLDGGVLDVGGVDVEGVAFAGELDVFDALGVTAVKAVGDAQDGGKLEDNEAFVAGEVGVVGVIGVGVITTVVAGEEGDDGAVAGAEAEDFGVEDEIERVFVVFAGADKHADLMQDGGDAEEEFVFGVEAVKVLQLGEEFLREFGDVFTVLAVGVEFFTDFAGSLENLLLEGFGLGAGVEEVVDKVAVEVTFGNDEDFVVEASGEGEVGLEGGDEAFRTGVVKVESAHHFVG